MTSYSPLKKNTHQRIVFPILDADGDPVTGASTPDTEVSIDGGDFTNCTDEIHEIATASGVYYIDLEDTETNGDCIAIQCKCATAGAKTTVLVFYTQSTNIDAVGTVITNIHDTDLPAVKTDTGAIVANVLAGIVEGTLTVKDAFMLITASTAGKLSGAGTNTLKFRNQADNKDRITATVDANNNRTAITTDLT